MDVSINFGRVVCGLLREKIRQKLSVFGHFGTVFDLIHIVSGPKSNPKSALCGSFAEFRLKTEKNALVWTVDIVVSSGDLVHACR